MKSLSELFPDLSSFELKRDDPRRELLAAPSLLEGERPVRHPVFSDVVSQVCSSVRASPLTLLIGASGVGKTRLVSSLVERLNGALRRPGRIPAIGLVAPTSQRTMFSWKAFWERLLTALEDPLPRAKVHPSARAEALRRDSDLRMRRTSESLYFEMVCSAAAQRGLAMLVIDEATALVRSQHGVTLLDQIAVLRELADTELFRVVLVSTFEILPHFRRAGVLDRRLSTVVFRRYAEILSTRVENSNSVTSVAPPVDRSDEGYLAFARSAVTFMQRLPESSRFTLTPEQLERLYRGSLGCVGLLCDWYIRAIADCFDSGTHRLQWTHFSRTPLSVDRRANLIQEARRAEDELALLGDRRLDLTEEELYQIGLAHARADRFVDPGVSSGRKASAGGAGAKRGSGRRPGIPKPRRRVLP